MALDTRDPLVKATDLAARIRERDQAVAAERERCAKIAETCGVEGDNWRRDIAAAIRNKD